MDKHLVKLAVKSAEDDLLVVVNKFLSNELISARDMCWWWNPARHWLYNYKYVRNVIRVLKKERCIREIRKHTVRYKKTKRFVEILYELHEEELLLRRCGVKSKERIITQKRIYKLRHKRTYNYSEENLQMETQWKISYESG